MSLKIEGSQNTVISHTLPFEIPDTQVSIEDSYYEFFDPSVNISDSPTKSQRNLRWDISGSSDMTDMANSYFVFRVNLAKDAAGTNYASQGATADLLPPDTDQVSLITNWSQLLVDRLNTYVNGVNLSEGDNYSHKSWAVTVLQQTEGSATEPLFSINTGSTVGLDNSAQPELCLMKLGSAEQEGIVLNKLQGAHDGDLATNTSRRYTNLKYVSANAFTIVIRPKDTLFSQEKFLVPQTKLRLDMLTSVPNFYCIGKAGATNPFLSIQSATAFIKRIKLSQVGEKSLLTTLAQNPAKYVFPRHRYTSQFLGKVQNKQIVSLLPGPRPNRVLVWFTRNDGSDSAVGNIGLNPLCSSNFDGAQTYVQRMYINLAGRQFPRKALEATGYNDTHRAYEMYKQACADNEKPLLSLDQFTYNHTIYCFNTTKTLTNDDDGLLSSGAMTDIQVNVLFNQVPAEDVVLHVVAIEDAVVEISSGGEVTKSY